MPKRRSRGLRQAHCAVRLDVKDLGGHLQFSRRRTNFSITQRLQALDGLWTRLARCRGPIHLKVRAVRQRAWPSAFHTA